jgi:hypothetical protein
LIPEPFHTGFLRRTLIAWSPLALALPLALAYGGERLRAQEASTRRLILLDGEYLYFSGTVALSFQRSWYVGGGSGFGLGNAVDNSGQEFTRYTHFGAVLGRTLGPRAAVDLGLETGLGDFRPDRCRGLFACYGGESEWYQSVALGFDVGGSRWRVGTRVWAARFKETDILSWTPVVLRGRF